MKARRRTGVVLAMAGAAVTVAVAAGIARERGFGVSEVSTLAESGAGNPTVAADAKSGAAYVAWAARSGEAWDVYLARVGEEGPSSRPVRVNDRGGDASSHEQAPPRVAVGPRGEVYVAWQKSTVVPGRQHPASDLRFARSVDGGRTFSPTVTVNDDALGPPASHTFHDLAVGADGTLVLSWLDSRVRDSARAARGAASAPVPASGDAKHGGHGKHAGEADLPGSEIRVAHSTDGGRTWSDGVVVDGGVCPCCRTAVATGPDGAVYVAWRKVFAGDVRDVVVARSMDGGRTFSAPVVVHRDGWVFPGCPHAGPALAVDARGRVHVAWYTGREGRQGLWYAVSQPGGESFGEPAGLLTGGWVPPSQVKMAADGDGVWMAWDDRRTAEKRLALARAGEDQPTPAASTLAGASPSVAVLGGRAVVAFHDGEAVRLVRAGER